MRARGEDQGETPLPRTESARVWRDRERSCVKSRAVTTWAHRLRETSDAADAPYDEALARSTMPQVVSSGRADAMRARWRDPRFAAAQRANLGRGREMRWSGRPSTSNGDGSTRIGATSGGATDNAPGDADGRALLIAGMAVVAVIVLVLLIVYLSRSTGPTNRNPDADSPGYGGHYPISRF